MVSRHSATTAKCARSNPIKRYAPKIKQTLLIALLCFSLLQECGHASMNTTPNAGELKQITNNQHHRPTEIKIGQEQQNVYDIYNTNTQYLQQYNQSSIYLHGPYSKIEELDQSYPMIMQEDQKMVLTQMEAPQPISSLFAEWDEKAFEEYKQIEQLTREETDTQVPETKIIGASFVKTPFHEMIPVSSGHTSPANFDSSLNQKVETPFGLMIASTGSAAKEGLLEFWQMIVNQNVHVMNSLNEAFTRDEDNREDIFRYFPNESEVTFNVDNIFKIYLKSNETENTRSTTTRHFYIRDFDTNKLVHSVKHVHFHQWQDFMTPSEESQVDLSALLQQEADFLFQQIDDLQNGRTQNPQKLLIHCRAGRGRTGTTMSILNSIMSLQFQLNNLQRRSSLDHTSPSIIRDQLKLSIFSIVRRLREQRAFAVETTDQYAYIYKFVDYWLSNKLKDDTKNTICNDAGAYDKYNTNIMS